MADVLVLVPRSEVAHFWEPIGPDEEAWWTLAVRPRHVEVGDHIYFQIEDAIVARARIDFIDAQPRRCVHRQGLERSSSGLAGRRAGEA